MRTFDTGATRDTDENKIDYEGHFNPLVDMTIAEYLHSCRYLKDGTIRDSDNWQLGIPKEEGLKSLLRHVMDIRLHFRGYSDQARASLKEAICASIFNLYVILHGILEEEIKREKDWEELKEYFKVREKKNFYRKEAAKNLLNSIEGYDE